MEEEGEVGDEGGAGFASSRFIKARVPGGLGKMELQVEVAVLGRCCNDR